MVNTFWTFILLCLLANNLGAQTFHVDASKEDHLPPYGWYDAINGGVGGYASLVVAAIAKELGFQVETQWIDTPSSQAPGVALQKVMAGQSDYSFFPPEYLPDAHALIVSAIPVYHVESRIFVARDSAIKFERRQELVGLRGGHFGELGVSGNPEFDRYAEESLSIVHYPSYAAVARALVDGELDYVVGVNKTLQLEFHLLGKRAEFTPRGPVIMKVPVHWIISSRSPMAKYAQAMESKLKQYQESGKLRLMMDNAMKQYLLYRHELDSRAEGE
ncbi:ABC transporter substrate-binding protein [Oceanicoccus sp. KOV_DT_Chl]|uniref:substrate-binding periplasmic protein n=1 Tax=Oceanicoccus sp. KOV_DT_Chl TaxID=1904639 RepID=UPI000C7B4396|nr:ABC transporter substrate-binding protein [Oceanicoccus sp. KOV_DT_Chl]